MVEKLLSVLKLLASFKVNLKTSDEEAFHQVREYEGEDAWIAAVSYIPLVSAAILLLRKDNSEFILTHSKQALILTTFALLIYMLLPQLISLILDGILVLLMAISVYKAFSGKKFYIPLVTELALLVEV